MASFIRNHRTGILLTLTFLVLVVSAIPLALPPLLGSRWFKEKLASTLSARLGRGVHLDGTLDITLGLTPKLSISKVRIDNQSSLSDRAMLDVGALTVVAPILPNLRTNFEINEVQLHDVKVLITADRSGRSNWDFTGDANPAPRNDEPRSVSIPKLKQVTLTNIAVELEHRGSAHILLFDNIEARDINLGEHGSLASSLSIDGIPIKLRGDLGSVERFLRGKELAFDVDVRQDTHELSGKGSVHRNGEIDVALIASGNNLAALSPLLGVTLPGLGPYNIKTHLTRTSGAVSSLKLKHLTATLSDRTLAGSIGLDISQNGDVAAELDLTCDEHHWLAKGGYRADGSADFNIKASGSELSELSPLFFTQLPAWNDYSVETRLILPADRSQFISFKDLKLRIGANDLEGNVDTRFAPLSIRADLRSNTFDLGVLTKLSQPDSAPSQGADTEPRIPYELFHAFDADIALKVANLTTFLDLKLNDADLTAQVKNGDLLVPTFAGRIFGGSFRASLDAKDKRAHLKLDGTQFDANPLQLLAGGTPFMRGQFDLAADITATGELLSDVKKSLTGKIDVSSDDAQLEMTSLHTMTSGLAQILSPIFGQSEQATSECLLFNYDLENGIAKSREQVLKLNDVFIFAKGQLDFPRNEISYNFNVNSTNPNLASLIPPFRAFGKINDPHFVPSITGSVASVADSAQGIAGSAFGVIGGAANFLLRRDKEDLVGRELCKKAYESEQNLISSKVGQWLEGPVSPAQENEGGAAAK